MLLFTEIAPLRAYLERQRVLGKSIGLIPTMGALHEGHISLLKESRSEMDVSVCSIFVNPTQFNNAEDLAKYPRTIENDIIKLETNGCDVLFHPTPEQVYPNGFATKEYNWGAITHSLEGAFRPGHFDGVITIVHKLFEIITPDKAYFGQKDFQQCAVIVELVKVFNLNIKVQICPIMRESDGLAMSSRNVRLNQQERQDALYIYEALSFIKKNQHLKSVSELIKLAGELLQKSPLLKPEYINIVDAQSLEQVTELLPNKQYVALITTWCGNVRLIDNMLLDD